MAFGILLLRVGLLCRYVAVLYLYWAMILIEIQAVICYGLRLTTQQ